MISDEKLAAYIDGMLSAEESIGIESYMDIDTQEVLNVASKAVNQGKSSHRSILPKWEHIYGGMSIFENYAAPLAMAGFLGEEKETDDDTEGSNEETGDDGEDKQ